MHKIKLIIFDFDGTIADTVKIIEKTEKKICKEHGYSELNIAKRLKNETFKKIFLNEIKNHPTHILPQYLRFKKEFSKNLKNIKIFDNMINIINKLSNDFLIGLLTTNISNTAEDDIKNILIKNNLKKFEFITKAKILSGKKDYINNIIKNYNLNPNQVILIGDSPSDIIASNDNKINSIAVLWGYSSKEMLEKENPTYIANTPLELIDIIYNCK